MSFARLQRILRARWWALVLVALVSIWIANQLTEFRNEQRPTREAVATITFQRLLGETSDEGTLTRLTNAESVAVEINATKLAERLHPLAPWEMAAIERDDRTFALRFIGRGATDLEATRRVEALMASFFEIEPFTGILGIQTQLDALSTEIIKLERNIAEAEAVDPPREPGEADFIATAELRALDAQIGALTVQHNTLKIELIRPLPPVDPLIIPRSSEEIQADIDIVFQLLVGLTVERQVAARAIEAATGGANETAAAAAPGPFSEEAFEDAIAVDFWRLQSEQLRTAYQDLFLRQVEAQSLVTVSEDIVVGPSSVQEVDVLTNRVLAVVAGLLVGLGGLIIADRVRKPLWESSDIEGLPQLPSIMPRGRFDTLEEPWYIAVPTVPRKAAIQALRATIEGVADSGTTVVGITGLHTKAAEVQELAADLATSLAVSGNSVLLIDANLDDPSRLVEFGNGDMNLADILLQAQLGDNTAGEATRDLYEEALERLSPVIPNLYGMTAGTRAANAPDIIARPHFGVLTRSASDRFDFIIVSGADIKSPISQVLSQRLDSMVLAATAGQATESDVTTVSREYGDRKARLLGVALLVHTMTAVGRRFWGLFPRRKPAENPSGTATPNGARRHELPVRVARIPGAEEDEEASLTGAGDGGQDPS